MFRAHLTELFTLQELRFIFPALPLLTMAGGVGLDSLLPSDSTGQCVIMLVFFELRIILLLPITQ